MLAASAGPKFFLSPICIGGDNCGIEPLRRGCYRRGRCQAVNSLYLETKVTGLVTFIVTEPGFQNTVATKPQRRRRKVMPHDVGET